jgi:predicted transcriptional regulator
LVRRSFFELTLAVLQVLAEGKLMRSTHIMYKSNVNMQILKGILWDLEQKGLIKKEYSKRSVFFSLTSKGSEVVRTYSSVKAAVGVHC